MSEPHSGKDFARARQIWIDQVGDDHELSPTAFKVAHHLSRHFDLETFLEIGDLLATPSYDVLSSGAGVDTRTVQRSIKQLRDGCHIVTAGGQGRGNALIYKAIIKPKPKPVRKIIAFPQGGDQLE